MKVQRSARFAKQFQVRSRCDRPLAKPVEKTVEDLLRFPPAHPALRMKRIQGTRDIYECLVNMDIRMTLEFSDPETI